MVSYTGNYKPQMCKHTLFQYHSANKMRRTNFFPFQS